jgi:hypothetical protein
MPIWITEYHRCNWNFGREIKQSVEVVFECDVEDDEGENHERLCEAAREALANDVKFLYDARLPGDTGWSSVLGGMTFEKVKVPHEDRELELPSEGKPVIACAFTYKGYRYRAQGFYRLHSYVKEFNPDDTQDQIWRQMDIDDGKDPDSVRYQMIQCLPEEADFVSGTGVAGCIAPIKHIEVHGLVQWGEMQLKQAQGEYEDKVSKLTDDDHMMNTWQLRPYINRYVEELNS